MLNKTEKVHPISVAARIASPSTVGSVVKKKTAVAAAFSPYKCFDKIKRIIADNIKNGKTPTLDRVRFHLYSETVLSRTKISIPYFILLRSFFG